MMYSEFKYIDAAFGGVQNRNHLIEMAKLKSFAEDWKKQYAIFKDCYKTYFRYPQEMQDHFAKVKSVKGYTGPCYADYLPLDIDSNDISKSHEATKEVLRFLKDAYEVDLKTVGIYFSGSKGFHVELPSQLFGLEPSPNLPLVLKEIALKLIPDGLTIDTAIYDKTRLWRLKNTINSKSRLHKIPLTSDELFRSSLINSI